MKNSKNKIIIGAALIMGAAFFYFNSKEKTEKIDQPADPVQTASSESLAHEPSHETTVAVSPSNEPTKVVKAHPATDSELADLVEFNDLSQEEKKSLITMSSVLKEAIGRDASVESIVDSLEEMKLQPHVLKDANPYTGEMNVIRTKMNLPGTRYLHAQYFSNNGASLKDSNLPQHISFELRPGKDSFKAAKKIVKKIFNITSAPTKDSDNFTSWSIPGRVVWVQKKTAKELVNDGFNSYDPKTDIGTVKVATEQEIH